jgi:hypothetical protein
MSSFCFQSGLAQITPVRLAAKGMQLAPDNNHTPV